MLKNLLSTNTQRSIFSGVVAIFMLSTAAVVAQSRIAQSEMSYCGAMLIGQTSGARVNLRSGPGINYQAMGYGLVGDTVHILNVKGNPQNLAVAEDNQGNSWYRVGFPKSGARGWIRGDYLQPECYN